MYIRPTGIELKNARKKKNKKNDFNVIYLNSKSVNYVKVNCSNNPKPIRDDNNYLNAALLRGISREGRYF